MVNQGGQTWQTTGNIVATPQGKTSCKFFRQSRPKSEQIRCVRHPGWIVVRKSRVLPLRWVMKDRAGTFAKQSGSRHGHRTQQAIGVVFHAVDADLAGTLLSSITFLIVPSVVHYQPLLRARSLYKGVMTRPLSGCVTGKDRSSVGPRASGSLRGGVMHRIGRPLPRTVTVG